MRESLLDFRAFSRHFSGKSLEFRRFSGLIKNVIDYRFKFPELYQFFGGYFYQGWAADYRWDGAKPDSAAVVRHFKAVNPPSTVSKVRNELEDFLNENAEDEFLNGMLHELGSSFYPESENLDHRKWLLKILEILAESPTKSRILRELR